ncbi:MAG: cysteine--tRNA ligase [Patescibacteria group bacterium]
MSDIFLHNTLTGQKEIFKPLKAGVVSMYNCGPTVYNYAHIGNLRSYIFADTLRRVFEYNNLAVTQVVNVTDIGHLSSDGDDGEDKMTKALKREGKPLTLEAMREVANFYFEAFKQDLKSLNIRTPEHFPFASDNIQEDINMILKLTDGGFTYTTTDGVYFDTEKFPEYGKLGNIPKIDDAESRIGVNNEKKNQRDFALWKFNSELGYEAPFGRGFPGWHIECSAMSVKYLGPEFDIHTGGIDHIPVHHNNEIAQAVCAGYPYAKYWLHNAHYNIGEEKMAKSGENFITLQTLQSKHIDPLALRYTFLSARYSSPLQFSFESLEGSDSALKRLRKIKSDLNSKVKEESEPVSTLSATATEHKEQFLSYINDDLDTPKALALMWDIIKNENISDSEKHHLLWDFDKVLGLNLDKVEIYVVPKDILDLVSKREDARQNKNFEESDRLRTEVAGLGFVIKDTDSGPEIRPI